MQLTLNLSNNVVRKLKALSSLEEIDDFEQFISDYLEEAVENRILKIIQHDRGTRGYDAGPVATLDSPLEAPQEFEVAAGLSHEKLEEPTPKPRRKPKTKKLTKEMVEKDDIVANPKIEAVSGGGEEQMTFEELVGSSLTDDGEEMPPVNIPPLEELSVVPRSNPRPLPKGVKAKVSTFEHIEEAM